MPRARGRALIGLAAKVAEDPFCWTAAPTARKCGQPCSPFLASVRTADYIALRALGDPDVFLPTDLESARSGPMGIDDVRRADSGAPGAPTP